MPRELNYFLDNRFGFSFVAGQLTRLIYEIEVDAAEVAGLTLREGKDVRVFAAQDLESLRVVPNDLFVLDLHISRGRGR